jgi:hypothetical protein
MSFIMKLGEKWIQETRDTINFENFIILSTFQNAQDQNSSNIFSSRDIGLEINAEKTKYMIMSRYPNSGQNWNIRLANESFENVAKFKYLGGTLTNQYDIRDEIKSRLNSGKCLLSFNPKSFVLPSYIKKPKG